MLDSRTKRTLIKNSPVTTQTPSWIIFSFDVERTKNSTYRSIVPGIHPFTITDSDISLLRTSRLTNYSSLIVLEIPRLLALRIRTSSILIESSFRGFSVYDLLSRILAPSVFDPRNSLDIPNSHLYSSSRSTSINKGLRGSSRSRKSSHQVIRKRLATVLFE